MNATRFSFIAIVLALAIGALAYGAYAIGVRRGASAAVAVSSGPAGVDSKIPAPATRELPQNIAQGEDATRRHIKAGIKAGDLDPDTGKRVLYYHDPMVPGNKFDKPAKSPFMDMMLVPVYAGSDGDNSRITISPRVQQNLGVRTAIVEEGVLAPMVETVGSIAFNERDQVIVQARATGFVEKLFVRATLDAVRTGQVLAEIYVPDWIAAQEEFLSMARMQGRDMGPLIDAARQRMRQVGMSQSQVALVEANGTIQARFQLAAPIDGVVTELLLREGMTVVAGATLFRINGLSSVWANAEVPESQAAMLRPGARVQVRSPTVPGAIFVGRVQAILPEVNLVTRTIKARLELANPGARLVPGTFVQMQIFDTRSTRALLVPAEAIIQTGKRSVVMLAEDNGRFRPVDVETGVESDGKTEVLRGLQRGQRIVVSSQFLIDSEASLKGVEARLNAAPAAASNASRHSSQATVEAVTGAAITLSHPPIPALKWGAMTMDFKLPPGGAPRPIARGDRVDFEFFMDVEGRPQLSSLRLIAPGPSPPPPAAAGVPKAKP